MPKSKETDNDLLSEIDNHEEQSLDGEDDGLLKVLDSEESADW